MPKKISTVALVTGGNRGIGREVVRQLAHQGWKVILAARDRVGGTQAAAKLKNDGFDVEYVYLDLTDEVSIRRAYDDVRKEVSHIDLLINNAGVLLDEDESILTVDFTTLSKTLLTNAVGPLLVTQNFLPLIIRSQSPRIVNVSSSGGSLSEMGHWSPAYSMSKAALNAVTKQLSAALRDDRVIVNSVCPGWVRTDMGGSEATLSVEEGAEAVIWAATVAPKSINGKFIRRGNIISW